MTQIVMPKKVADAIRRGLYVYFRPTGEGLNDKGSYWIGKDPSKAPPGYWPIIVPKQQKTEAKD